MANLVNKNLKKKSIEAFLLSIEIYNKPTINYRIETASFLLCNAWELALKASWIAQKGLDSIYRDKHKSFSLEEMLNKFYQDNSQIKANLKYIIDNIRNKATHFFIPEFDTLYLGVFHKAVLNYVDFMKEKLNVDISEYLPLESLSIIVKNSATPKTLEKMYGKKLAKDFKDAEMELNKFITDNTTSDSSVVAYVKQKIFTTKNSAEADFKVYSSRVGGIGIKEIYTEKDDVNKVYPFIMKQVINTVKEHFANRGQELNHLHYKSLCDYIKLKNIKQEPKYYKEINLGDSISKKYSQEFVNLIIEKCEEDKKLFRK